MITFLADILQVTMTWRSFACNTETEVKRVTTVLITFYIHKGSIIVFLVLPASTSHAEGERELLEGHVWYFLLGIRWNGPKTFESMKCLFSILQIMDPHAESLVSQRREPHEGSHSGVLPSRHDFEPSLSIGSPGGRADSLSASRIHIEKASLCNRGKKIGSSIQSYKGLIFVFCFILLYVARILCYIQKYTFSYQLTIHCYLKYC